MKFLDTTSDYEIIIFSMLHIFTAAVHIRVGNLACKVGCLVQMGSPIPSLIILLAAALTWLDSSVN